MRKAFFQTLMQAAREDSSIWFLTADVGFSVIEPFQEAFPDRFVNVGISEQNMAGIAAGLALSGKRVFVYSIGNFVTLRCLEQIRNDVCYHKLPVTFVGTGSGFVYGTQGYTHHITEDLAATRALPGLRVFAPADPTETAAITRFAATNDGPNYIRLAKAGEPVLHKAPLDPTAILKALVLREGRGEFSDSTAIVPSRLDPRLRGDDAGERGKDEEGYGDANKTNQNNANDCVQKAPLTSNRHPREGGDPGDWEPTERPSPTALTLIATGNSVSSALEAAKLLAAEGIDARVVSLPCLAPLDAAFLRAEAHRVPLIATIEEHGLAGGLGEAVGAILAEESSARLLRFGIDARVIDGHVGTQSDLCHLFGLCPDQIAESVKRKLKTV